MRTRCSVVTLAALIASAQPWFAVSAWACSCYSPSGPKALPSAAAMFTGKAVRVEFLEPDADKKEPPILVTFAVREVWKGPVKETLTLRTTYNKWTCSGYYFKQGETYLVTASQATENKVTGAVELAGVSPCGATRELDRAADIIRQLGTGQKPAAAPAKGNDD